MTLRAAAWRPKCPVQPQLVAGAPYGIALLRNTYLLCTADEAVPVGRLPRLHRRATVGTDGERVVVVAGFDPTPEGRPRRYELWVLHDGEARLLHELGHVSEPFWLGVDAGLVVVGWMAGLGSRYRALQLQGGRVLWETEAPGDTHLVQSATGGPIGALTLGSRRGEFRWLQAARATLSPPAGVPLGIRLEIPSVRRCDLDSATNERQEQILQAQAALVARDWGVALARLEGLSTHGEHGPHVLHLRGLAAMMAGDRTAAEAAFQPLAELAHDCDVRWVLPIAAAWAKAESRWARGADPTVLATLRHHIRTVAAADRALAEGDAQGAWQRLDDLPSWHSDDAQLAARRLAAALRLEEVPLLELLRALASLQGAPGDIPGVPSWPTDRLASLVARARERLGDR